MSVITNSLAMMDTSSTITSLDADAVVYDNTTSGLTATDAQAAIDELDNTIDTISTEIGSLDAADIEYIKTIPGDPVAITNVQEAFDYLLSVDTAQPVPSRIVNYYDSSGFLFYDTYSVQEALEKIDYVLSDFLEKTSSGEYSLPTNNIVLPSASKTGIYANADDVQDALDAIKTALGSGGGGSAVDASDVSFDDASGYWGGACAGNVDQALRDLDERVVALSKGGGGGPVDASDVTFDYTKSSCWGGSSGDSVEDALFDLDERVRGLSGVIDTTDVAIPSASRTGIYATAATAQAALDVVKTELSSLDSTDITIPAASKTGIYANTATVQQALDAIKTAISSGGGGGSSSASSVSFTKPQGGIYSSGTDTVQEALEDVSAKVLDLAASDIVYVNGCGGSYPTEVETVHDALKCLQHLLLKYSEFEEETGWLWFNDKPIYQVSIEEIESGTTNLFDTNELEIDDLVYMEATLTDSSGAKRWTISGSSGDFYWNTATHMIVYGGSDVVTTATIRYTKTSD